LCDISSFFIEFRLHQATSEDGTFLIISAFSVPGKLIDVLLTMRSIQIQIDIHIVNDRQS